jgi:hypothetical protein
MEYARRRKFWIRSNDDPRWNYEGEGVSTRFDQPQEMLDWIEKKKIEYGDKPVDLKVGYF